MSERIGGMLGAMGAYIDYHESECEWTFSDDKDDDAMFTTSCGKRVEPAPGLQLYCHMCGRKISIPKTQAPRG